jgi:aspartate kinase
MFEKAMITEIRATAAEAVYSVRGVEAAALFVPLGARGVNVDMIIGVAPEIVFSAPREDRQTVASVLDGLGADWSERVDVGRVTVIGVGLKTHPDVVATVFRRLAELGVEPEFVSTSPIKMAFYVPEAEHERTIGDLRALLLAEAAETP